MAVIDVESRFDRWAVSSAGAQGLMQVMPFWPRAARHERQQLVQIPHNMRMGCAILKFYYDRERGDYTQGARALQRQRRPQELSRSGAERLDRALAGRNERASA